MKLLKLFRMLNRYRKKYIARQASDNLLINTLRMQLINSEAQIKILNEELSSLKEALAKEFIFVTYRYDHSNIIKLPKEPNKHIDYAVSIPVPTFILCYKNRPLKDYEEDAKKISQLNHLVKLCQNNPSVVSGSVLRILKGKNSD